MGQSSIEVRNSLTTRICDTQANARIVPFAHFDSESRRKMHGIVRSPGDAARSIEG